MRTALILCDYCGLRITHVTQDTMRFDAAIHRDQRWQIAVTLKRYGSDNTPDLHPSCAKKVLASVEMNTYDSPEQKKAVAAVKKLARGPKRAIRLRE